MTASRPRPQKDKRSPGATPGSAADPVRNLLPDQRQALRALFAPARVAVVGATEKEGSVGRTLLWNLITHPFGGTVFPVNPKRTSLLGIKAYPDLASLPEPVDLAVVVTPAPSLTSPGPRGGAKPSLRFERAGFFFQLP